MPVEPGIFRHTDCPTAVFAKNRSLGLVDGADFQNGLHLLPAHPASGAVGPGGTGLEPAGVKVFFSKPILQLEVDYQTTSHDNNQSHAFQPIQAESCRIAGDGIPVYRLHPRLPGDTVMFQPDLIVGKELPQHPAQIQEHRDCKHNADCHGNPALIQKYQPP